MVKVKSTASLIVLMSLSPSFLPSTVLATPARGHEAKIPKGSRPPKGKPAIQPRLVLDHLDFVHNRRQLMSRENNSKCIPNEVDVPVAIFTRDIDIEEILVLEWSVMSTMGTYDGSGRRGLTLTDIYDKDKKERDSFTFKYVKRDGDNHRRSEYLKGGDSGSDGYHRIIWHSKDSKNLAATVTEGNEIVFEEVAEETKEGSQKFLFECTMCEDGFYTGCNLLHLASGKCVTYDSARQKSDGNGILLEACDMSQRDWSIVDEEFWKGA